MSCILRYPLLPSPWFQYAQEMGSDPDKLRSEVEASERKKVQGLVQGLNSRIEKLEEQLREALVEVCP